MHPLQYVHCTHRICCGVLLIPSQSITSRARQWWLLARPQSIPVHFNSSDRYCTYNHTRRDIIHVKIAIYTHTPDASVFAVLLASGTARYSLHWVPFFPRADSEPWAESNTPHDRTCQPNNAHLLQLFGSNSLRCGSFKL